MEKWNAHAVTLKLLGGGCTWQCLFRMKSTLAIDLKAQQLHFHHQVRSAIPEQDVLYQDHDRAMMNARARMKESHR